MILKINQKYNKEVNKVLYIIQHNHIVTKI
jgi:hypothetical protein